MARWLCYLGLGDLGVGVGSHFCERLTWKVVPSAETLLWGRSCALSCVVRYLCFCYVEKGGAVFAKWIIGKGEACRLSGHDAPVREQIGVCPPLRKPTAEHYDDNFFSWQVPWCRSHVGTHSSLGLATGYLIAAP